MDDGIRGSRRLCAAFWMFVLAAAIGSIVFEEPRAGLVAFASAVVVSFLTIVMSKLTRDERLDRPGAYRIAAGALLVVSLAGGVLAVVPHASEKSQILGVFFGLVAVLSYRALVAQGPRRAMFGVVIAMWTWLPFLVVTMIGCSCGRRFERVEHWSEVASTGLLSVLVMMLPVLATASLLAFVPRRDFVPDARVVR
ncbi:MAG: hypothetical protein M4D80_04910 [Myxococcota bacterium]|nr:hypothetical protein [Myxococcota bacterium]